MKRTLFFSVFLLAALCGNGYAQDTLTTRQTNIPYSYWALKLPLCNILDPNSPNLQVGVERRLSKRSGLQLTGGISVDPDRKVLNGFRLKGEYRWHFATRNNHSLFLAGELFYTQYSGSVSETFVRSTDSTLYDDHFMIYKKMYGANVKFGFYKMFKKHFMFEVYSGIGVKHKIVSQQGRINPSDAPESVVDINLGAISHETGIVNALSMPLNFALGYIFR